MPDRALTDLHAEHFTHHAHAHLVRRPVLALNQCDRPRLVHSAVRTALAGMIDYESLSMRGFAEEQLELTPIEPPDGVGASLPSTKGRQSVCQLRRGWQTAEVP